MKLPVLELNDKNKVPALGLDSGTAWFKGGGKGPFETELVDLLKVALNRGFLHIDCAESYGTEQEVGQAIKDSGLPREKIFVTSKVQDTINDIPRPIDQTLKSLDLDYVDLYMIHWPYFAQTDEDLQAAWAEMEKVQQSGKAKSIGVSNYLRPHLEATLKTATVVPAVNQIEFHPYLQRANDYVPWMPLVPVTVDRAGRLHEPLQEIAASHGGVSVGAVLLRWQMQQGVIPITTSRHASRLEDYAQVTEFELTSAEMETITSIGLTPHFRAWLEARFAPDDRT
ncbi:putative ketoreductase [Aspergillus insuetus]